MAHLRPTSYRPHSVPLHTRRYEILCVIAMLPMERTKSRTCPDDFGEPRALRASDASLVRPVLSQRAEEVLVKDPDPIIAAD